jgi:hypothetical protein
MPKKLREIDIAKPVVAYLQARGWTVYQEVELLFGIADIVAELDGKLWVVEVKNSLSLALIAQANRWLGSTHWVSLAIPRRNNSVPLSEARRFGMQLLEERGIGVFVVDFSTNTQGRVLDYLSTRPRMFRRPNLGHLQGIRESLKPVHKTFAEAGSPGGAHWTPYKGSCLEIEQYVKYHPGCTVKELVDELGKLHYSNGSSARHSLSAMARGGHIPGIEAKTVEGKLRLFGAAELGGQSKA